MHHLLKKHIFLKEMNLGKYKILTITTSNFFMILISVFFKQDPIIIQKINNIYYINFIFKNNCSEEILLFLKDIIFKEYNTDDYISFCLTEGFVNNTKVSLSEKNQVQNVYLFKDKLMSINFFDYENIIDLY